MNDFEDNVQLPGNVANAARDGAMESAHLASGEFNVATAAAIMPWLERLYFSTSGHLFVVDGGGGDGGVLSALREPLAMRDDMRDVSLILIEIDRAKIGLAQSRSAQAVVENPAVVRIGFHAVVGELMEIPIRREGSPILYTQRAVTHYYVPGEADLFDPACPETMPALGFTLEQQALYHVWRDTFPIGSLIIDILSSCEGLYGEFGAKVGLQRFQYMLNQIAGGKRLNYLTVKDVIRMTMSQPEDSRQLVRKPPIILPGQFGHRNIQILWNRYGSGGVEVKPQFREQLIEAYLRSLDLYPGETSMFVCLDRLGNMTQVPSQIFDIWMKMEYQMVVMEVVGKD